MRQYTELRPTAATAYAQLLDATLAAEHARSVADLSGGFSSKTIKGKRYWYYQYREAGKLRQVYVGPDSPAVNALVERKQGPRAADALPGLAGAALALGNTPMQAQHMRVIRRLAEYGFFHAGGLLIGTHAFLAMGNMLGVKWHGGDRTQDMDFAHAGKQVSIALPSTLKVNTQDALASLEMGFIPLMQSDGKASATLVQHGSPEFQLDFLTTLHRGGRDAYKSEQLGILLQPLKFMEYLLQDVQQAVAFNTSTVALVNVPSPARYALHKLIVAVERPPGQATKSRKDVLQAASLLEWLQANAPHQIEAAWEDLRQRGRGWVTRFMGGARRLRLTPGDTPLPWEAL